MNKSLNKLKPVLSFFLAGFITFFSMDIIISKGVLNHFNGSLHFVLFALASLFLSTIIGIILHELGHLIAGLASGYRFLTFRVGNIVLVKYKTEYAWKKYYLPGTAGQCLMEPPVYNEGKFPFVLYNSGGWIMNMVLALIGIIIFLISSNIYLRTFSVLFTFIQIFLALTNAIPIKFEMGLSNDGMNILYLKKNPEDRKGFWMMLKVNALMTQGMRYQDIPEEYMETPKKLSAFTVYQPIYKSMYHLERGEYEKTEEILEELLKTPEVLSINETIITYDLLTCRILLHENREELKKELNKYLTNDFKKIDKIFKSFLNRNRFWAIYYRFVEEDLKSAEEYETKFHKIAEVSPSRGEVASERGIFLMAGERLEEKCENVGE